MLGIKREDEPDLPGIAEIKNSLADRLYTLMDEYDELKTYQMEEVLDAARAYFRFGEKRFFSEKYIDD